MYCISCKNGTVHPLFAIHAGVSSLLSSHYLQYGGNGIPNADSPISFGNARNSLA